MKKQTLFTVFTPTFNRAHTLHRVYESLLSQTLQDFEWLIVDDGSTDKTEHLIQNYIKENKIQIIYIKQLNSGKHVAFNVGVSKAQGCFFVPLDSDDTCTPDALECFYNYWMDIPEDKRKDFSGITCQCKTQDGKIVGTDLPIDFIDGSRFKIINQFKLKGERWGFIRTDIVKEYLYPVFYNEKFIAEGLVWNRVSKKYKNRFIKKALRTYIKSTDSLSSSSIKIRKESPNGTTLYYMESLTLPISLKEKLKSSINFWRFIPKAKNKITKIKLAIYSFPIIILFLPIGFSISIIDHILLSKEKVKYE